MQIHTTFVTNLRKGLSRGSPKVNNETKWKSVICDKEICQWFAKRSKENFQLFVYHSVMGWVPIILHRSKYNLLVYNSWILLMLSLAASSTDVTTIPTSVLSQVMDQATLSTMQAEMIAVQVLSQSATGDIQYLQHQSPARFIPIVTSTDSSTLNSLQATLSQMPLATLQVSIWKFQYISWLLLTYW